ncbi:MAG: VIT domain-containing protein [Bacteroidota bacterium]|nr:VIT domain-containing protein [Candidatus Kapabacteria bacterium]MDW8219536.1 VIT domain-containing protein [Bacteroidota bacterium]
MCASIGIEVHAQALQPQHASFLRVADPRGTWNRSGQGRIEEAVLTIAPCGVYAQCELFLTFSSAGTSLLSSRDSLEVQFDFFLPLGAWVTDSWLWVGQDIVQAKIFDRTTATTVYESIVQRRQDPSLLTKNYGGYYSLRIFPMRGDETRKVKIAYLLPMEWRSNAVYASIPTSLLRASSRIPSLTVLYYPEQDWSIPSLAIQQGNSVALAAIDILRPTQELQTGRRVFMGKIDSELIRSSTVSALEWKSPMRDGIMLQLVQRGEECYYHLVIDARRLFNIQASDSLEIDNVRLKSGSTACYDRYNITMLSREGHYTASNLPITIGVPVSIRPSVPSAFSPLYAPLLTSYGTRRLDNQGIIQEVGRCIPSNRFLVGIGGYLNNLPVAIERAIPFERAQRGAVCSYLAWVGNHIAGLENTPINTSFERADTVIRARQRHIVQLSLENRVLSSLTAFLALEPNDTTPICSGCYQPSTGNPALAGANNPLTIAPSQSTQRRALPTQTIDALDERFLQNAHVHLTVSPNPSYGTVRITMQLSEPIHADARSLHVGIYDVLGRCIRTVHHAVLDELLKQGVAHLIWDGDDDGGHTVAAGVYVVVVQTPFMRRSITILRLG